MKKVLVVGYFWPYRSGGSGRMLGLAKYLCEFGWSPIILTAPLEYFLSTVLKEKVRVIEAAFPGDIYELFRKCFGKAGFDIKKSITEQVQDKTEAKAMKSRLARLRTLYQEIFGYPDTEKKWKHYALTAARNFLWQEKVDAMISVWPVTSHLIAHALKQEYGIPWIADFPDPWAENHAYPYGKIRKYFDRRLEKKTIRTADALTAASPMYAEKQERLHGRETLAIMHGFDPDDFQGASPTLTKKFTITYTGTIYPSKQEPRKFFQALQYLVNFKKIDPSHTEVRFYGGNLLWLRPLIHEYGLASFISVHGGVSREEAHKRQMESQVLLLFGWEEHHATGVYPLKTFEYLAAKRPILVSGGSADEEIKNIIRSAHAGVTACESADIEKAVLNFYQEYKAKGFVEYWGSSQEIENYSYRTMARRFSEILNVLTRKS